MPALNFQKRFAPRVEDGTKRQTIRARRKDGRDPKPGDPLYLYTGMRTKGCRKLGVATCTSVDRIGIDGFLSVWIGAEPVLGPLGRRSLAVADGFAGWRGMYDWFQTTHGIPFEGLLIRW